MSKNASAGLLSSGPSRVIDSNPGSGEIPGTQEKLCAPVSPGKPEEPAVSLTPYIRLYPMTRVGSSALPDEGPLMVI